MITVFQGVEHIYITYTHIYTAELEILLDDSSLSFNKINSRNAYLIHVQNSLNKYLRERKGDMRNDLMHRTLGRFGFLKVNLR